MIPTRKEWMEALEERHGMALQQKFSGATVAVCGLGGLGSHIATTLARAGVGTSRDFCHFVVSLCLLFFSLLIYFSLVVSYTNL